MRGKLCLGRAEERDFGRSSSRRRGVGVRLILGEEKMLRPTSEIVNK